MKNSEAIGFIFTDLTQATLFKLRWHDHAVEQTKGRY